MDKERKEERRYIGFLLAEKFARKGRRGWLDDRPEYKKKLIENVNENVKNDLSSKDVVKRENAAAVLGYVIVDWSV